MTGYTNLLEFQVLCEQHSLELPAVAAQALEALDLASDLATNKPVRVLNLTPDQMIDYMKDQSIRRHTASDLGNTMGYANGISTFREQVWNEAREALLPEIDGLVEQLRPQFRAAVEPLVIGAQKYGFTYATTSDQVINMRDSKAADAWYNVSQAWTAAIPLANARTKFSTLFDISPTRGELDDMELLTATENITDSAPNWSICFAAGDTWSTGGHYMLERKSSVGGLDWLAIAAEGLTLNTPTEVREKITKRRALARELSGA